MKTLKTRGADRKSGNRASRGPHANYLLFSDVHLGADLVQHVRPWTWSRLREIARVDRDLAQMLDYYREHRDPQRPWCLVIAGDLVDFVGMSIAPRPETPLETELNDDERLHGLGSARDHAVAKMQAVTGRHGLVFDRLAKFIAEGHHLVLVRGNHDVDFHWDAARDAFVRAVVDRIDVARRDAELRAELESRIEFHPWFYYVEGLLYVEHGHQFDAVCNYPHLLAPISPADSNRLHWSLSDWLLRVVARPTPGLGQEGHDRRGMMDYLRFAWSLGVLGAARLFHRLLQALIGALQMGRHAVSERARAIHEEHERRMAELASRTRIRLDHLRELTAMWPKPVTSRIWPALRSVYLDRVMFGTLGVGAIGGLLWWRVPLVWGATTAAAVTAACIGYGIWAARKRMLDMDPTAAMRRGACRIAQLLPARFVVMGHTHEPAMERVSEAVTYVNLGHWGVDDLDGQDVEATRTHLVLRWVDGTHRAEFYRWDRHQGPRPLE